MAQEQSSTKRRREPYSRLICLGCRQRRIRCSLPDTTINPSPQPQPLDKACDRCRHNGLDCVVDYTTLGRPAQKRGKGGGQPLNRGSTVNDGPGDGEADGVPFEDEISHDVGNFILSDPEVVEDEQGSSKRPPALPPTKTEMIEACFSPFHMLPALLARDGHFASTIGSQPLVRQTVIELIDEEMTKVLDRHLVWHRLYYPDIPTLSLLRDDIFTMERGHTERPSCIFLLTLLYDLALDVPSTELATLRSLQPAVRALLFHTGQQVLFSLARTHWTVLALVLVAQYRPLAFTSSQPAAAQALKAVPYALLAKQICTELAYHTAGSRLSEYMHSFSVSPSHLTTLIHECLHWIRLGIAHELITNARVENVFKFRPADASTAECAEALGEAALLGMIPGELLLPWITTCGLYQMLQALQEMSVVWRDLGALERSILRHRDLAAREKETLEVALGRQGFGQEVAEAVLQLAGAALQGYHGTVKGCAMFFAVMSATHTSNPQPSVQPTQALSISTSIISQLTAHTETDPSRPTHRIFLETHGRTRINELELDLANFVSAAETLSLNGVRFVGPARQVVTDVLFTAKDIVEQQAARLKGWGGLDDRVDVQMILFLEVARKLEGMSAQGGTPEALAKGCILTATAKLLRSLHRILQTFKRTAAMLQRQANAKADSLASAPDTTTTSASSTGRNATPSSSDSTGGGTKNAVASETHPELPLAQTQSHSTTSNPEFEVDFAADLDLFAHWENWPQFDPADFSDLFGAEIFDSGWGMEGDGEGL